VSRMGVCITVVQMETLQYSVGRGGNVCGREVSRGKMSYTHRFRQAAFYKTAGRRRDLDRFLISHPCSIGPGTSARVYSDSLQLCRRCADYEYFVPTAVRPGAVSRRKNAFRCNLTLKQCIRQHFSRGPSVFCPLQRLQLVAIVLIL